MDRAKGLSWGRWIGTAVRRLLLLTVAVVGAYLLRRGLALGTAQIVSRLGLTASAGRAGIAVPGTLFSVAATLLFLLLWHRSRKRGRGRCAALALLFAAVSWTELCGFAVWGLPFYGPPARLVALAGVAGLFLLTKAPILPPVFAALLYESMQSILAWALQWVPQPYTAAVACGYFAAVPLAGLCLCGLLLAGRSRLGGWPAEDWMAVTAGIAYAFVIAVLYDSIGAVYPNQTVGPAVLLWAVLPVAVLLTDRRLPLTDRLAEAVLAGAVAPLFRCMPDSGHTALPWYMLAAWLAVGLGWIVLGIRRQSRGRFILGGTLMLAALYAYSGSQDSYFYGDCSCDTSVLAEMSVPLVCALAAYGILRLWERFAPRSLQQCSCERRKN